MAGISSFLNKKYTSTQFGGPFSSQLEYFTLSMWPIEFTFHVSFPYMEASGQMKKYGPLSRPNLTMDHGPLMRCCFLEGCVAGAWGYNQVPEKQVSWSKIYRVLFCFFLVSQVVSSATVHWVSLIQLPLVLLVRLVTQWVVAVIAKRVVGVFKQQFCRMNDKWVPLDPKTMKHAGLRF